MLKELLLLSLSALFVSIAWSAATAKDVSIINESGQVASVYWVDPRTRASELMIDAVIDGGVYPLNTWVGHEFEIREVPNPKTGVCAASPDQSCRIHHFIVSANDEQVIRIQTGFVVAVTDSATKASEDASSVITTCREQALSMVGVAANDDAIDRVMEDMLTCVESGVARQMEQVNEEIAYQSQIRRILAAQLENYTCEDDTHDTTPSVETRVWEHKDGINRTVHVKFERPASRIHVIENFINEAECKAMEEAAKPTLHRATVADGKGGSQFSEHRKAMQAGIAVQWDKEAEGDLIAQLSRRVYDYANHVLGLDIKENGQEDLMSIQYFGRGANDTAPDRYTPHCDGDCTGLPHKSGTRMATMVLYCDVPKRGGHTNFRNAGVHVAPVSGNGIFFSYIDPKTLIMDTGFTEHSGCPVFEGQKKIVTQWIRYGVDDANPWHSFNTLGIKHAEAAEQ